METKTHFAPAGKVLEPRAGRGRLAVGPALRSLPPLRRPPGHPGCVRSALPPGDSPGPAALPRALPSPAPPRPGKRSARRSGPQENPQDGRLPVMFTHWPGATTVVTVFAKAQMNRAIFLGSCFLAEEKAPCAFLPPRGPRLRRKDGMRGHVTLLSPRRHFYRASGLNAACV